MRDPETFTLSGDYENRVIEALRVAQHQVRLAQAQAAPRTQDALIGLEDALSHQIAWLENAADDGKADAEEVRRGRARASVLAPAEGSLNARTPHLAWPPAPCPRLLPCGALERAA